MHIVNAVFNLRKINQEYELSAYVRIVFVNKKEGIQKDLISSLQPHVAIALAVAQRSVVISSL